MSKAYPIHQNARVVAEMAGDDCPILVVQRLLDGEWKDVDLVQLEEGDDAYDRAAGLAAAYRQVVAAAPGRAFSDPFGADLLRTWKGAMRDAQPAQAGHMGAVAEILRDDRKGAA